MNRNSPSDKALAGQEPVKQEEKKSGKAPMTWGKRFHNELTFRVVDWLANSTVGVGTAFGVERTKFGEEKISKPIKGFFTWILEPVLKNPSHIAEGALWGSRLCSIIVGGMAIIPAMMWLEKKENKKWLSKTFDQWIYGKEKVESDPKFKQAYDAIDHEPIKDFSMGLASRMAVVIPTLIASLLISKHMEKWIYDPISWVSKTATAKLGLELKTLKQKGKWIHPEGDVSKPKVFESDWNYIHKIIGMDFGLTLIYAFIHEPIYKLFAALKYGNKKSKDYDEPSSKELPLKENRVFDYPNGKLNWTDKFTPKHQHVDHAIASSSPQTPLGLL